MKKYSVIFERKKVGKLRCLSRARGESQYIASEIYHTVYDTDVYLNCSLILLQHGCTRSTCYIERFWCSGYFDEPHLIRLYYQTRLCFLLLLFNIHYQRHPSLFIESMRVLAK